MELLSRLRNATVALGLHDDRFGYAARCVMRQAALEAYRLNHRYLGTEHVLLGLVSEDEARLERLPGVDLHEARAAVERDLMRGPGPSLVRDLAPTPQLEAMVELAAQTARERLSEKIAPCDLWDALLQQLESCGSKIARSLKAR